MELVAITFILLIIAFVAFWWGTWKLAKYGFRISTGTGVGILLCAPFALYFSFFKLQEEGKELPLAMVLFGLVSSALITVVFWTPISMTLTGRLSELDAPQGIAEASLEYGEEGVKKRAAEILKNMPVVEEKPDPTPTPIPVPISNGTNNAPATNNAPPTDPKEGAAKEVPKGAEPTKAEPAKAEPAK